MTVYRATGSLTGTVNDMAAAQAYLQEDAMVKYVSSNADLEGTLVWIAWNLTDESSWAVTAVTTRDLTEDELKRLSSEVSGQNSDGLGEGFEQQPFAEEGSEESVDCYECDGSGELASRDEDEEDPEEHYETCGTCDGAGYFDEDNTCMVSFDWETNPVTFEKVS